MPGATRTPQTLYDKVLQAHIVDEKLDGTVLLYIDRHLVHEVTSPVRIAGTHSSGVRLTDHSLQQAFEGLENAGRKVRRPDCTLATTDHVSSLPASDLAAKSALYCQGTGSRVGANRTSLLLPGNH